MEFDGIIAGIGVDTNFISFVHCPEDVIKKQFPIKTRLDQVFEAKVKLKDGSLKLLKHWRHIHKLRTMISRVS